MVMVRIVVVVVVIVTVCAGSPGPCGRPVGMIGIEVVVPVAVVIGVVIAMVVAVGVGTARHKAGSYRLSPCRPLAVSPCRPVALSSVRLRTPHILLGMAAQQIKPLHVDKNRPIVGRAGGFEHADDREGVVLVTA